MNRNRNIAVYLDFDNIKLGLDNNNEHFDIKLLMDYLKTKGKLSLLKAYADWDKLAGLFHDEIYNNDNYKHEKKTLHTHTKEQKLQRIKEIRKIKRMLVENNFDIIDMPSKKGGKNFSDIQLVVDCLETSILNKSIDTIALISGDSDMTPLIKRIRYYGLEVIIIGVDNSVSKMLISSSDIFRYYKFLNLQNISSKNVIDSSVLFISKIINLSILITGSNTVNDDFIRKTASIFDTRININKIDISEMMKFIKKQELIDYKPAGKGKYEIIEMNNEELVPINLLLKYLNYDIVSELKKYNKPYKEILNDYGMDFEKLTLYFKECIQDFICYAVYSNKTPKIIIRDFLGVSVTGDDNDEYKTVSELFNTALNQLIKEGVVIYNNTEKIYVPNYTNEKNKMFYHKREMNKLKSNLYDSENEKEKLRKRIKKFKKAETYHQKLLDAINLIEINDDIQKAVALLEEVASSPYYNKTANLYLGKAYMRIGKFKNAVTVYNHLLEQGINLPVVLNVLGTAYVKLKDYKNALEKFRHSLSLQEDQPKINQFVMDLSNYFSNNNLINTT